MRDGNAEGIRNLLMKNKDKIGIFQEALRRNSIKSSLGKIGNHRLRDISAAFKADPRTESNVDWLKYIEEFRLKKNEASPPTKV